MEKEELRKQKEKEASKKYYLKNKEKIKLYSKKYYSKNKDKVRERIKKYLIALDFQVFSLS